RYQDESRVQGVTLTRIAINGFGRIGRNTLRALSERGSELEVVAINDLGPVADLARLLKFDTTLGRYKHTVETTDDSIIIDGKSIKVYAEKDPAKLPWGELDVDVALESPAASRRPTRPAPTSTREPRRSSSAPPRRVPMSPSPTVST